MLFCNWLLFFGKSIQNHPDSVCENDVNNALNVYTLFDGLAYNTCGYFASFVVFSEPPQGRGKIRAMSKMSARIIR